MKKKHPKIVVKTLENTKREWKEALEGKRKGVQKDDEIIFTSLEAVARVFSKGRMEILRAVICCSLSHTLENYVSPWGVDLAKSESGRGLNLLRYC